MDAKTIARIFEGTAYVRMGGSEEELKCAKYLQAECQNLGLNAEIVDHCIFARRSNVIKCCSSVDHTLLDSAKRRCVSARVSCVADTVDKDCSGAHSGGEAVNGTLHAAVGAKTVLAKRGDLPVVCGVHVEVLDSAGGNRYREAYAVGHVSVGGKADRISISTLYRLPLKSDV